MKKIKIVVAGGGSSSGHITPLVAVINALQSKLVEVLWIGDNSARTRELAAEAKAEFIGIPTGKIHRRLTFENIKTPFRYWAGIRAAGKVLDEFQPDVVFGKGGSVSLPVVKAAHRRGIPIVIHESDARMGLANLWAAQIADLICVSYPIDQYPARFANKLLFTGVPVRPQFLTVTAHTYARPRLLVTGGGQGSVAINRALWGALPALSRELDIDHLTGPASFTEARTHQAMGYRSIAYARTEMAQLLADADLVLSRASATTLAEIAVIGRPAILVPLPSAANDHQRANARAWTAAGAGVVIEERDLTSDRLIQEIHSLLGDKKARTKMAKAARLLAHPEAATEIAKAILSMIKPEAK